MPKATIPIRNSFADQVVQFANSQEHSDSYYSIVNRNGAAPAVALVGLPGKLGRSRLSTHILGNNPLFQLNKNGVIFKS